MADIYRIGKVTIPGGVLPTQIKTTTGKLVYHRVKDNFSKGQMVYKYDGGWKKLECEDCGISAIEADEGYICPECNATFR